LNCSFAGADLGKCSFAIANDAQNRNLPLAQTIGLCHVPPMTSVAELISEASKLDRTDRVELVSSLLEDLDPDPHCVSDGEALKRLDDLKSGRVKGLSEDEFWKACARP
jgi:hypothetical protein